MKITVKYSVLLSLLWASSGAALATLIPPDVDFRAYHTQPQTLYPGDTGYVSNYWVILQNRYNYDDPEWVDDSWLTIDNVYRPTNYRKDLWPEITFTEVMTGVPFLPYVIANSNVTDSAVTITDNMITWYWELTPQPPWEDIGFVDHALTRTFRVATFDYDGVNGLDIERIEIATKCFVPEPGTLLICGIGLALAGLYRRASRR